MKTGANRGRIDVYGNFINQIESENFPGIKGVIKKDENLPNEAVELDMIKFYGKNSTFALPEEKTTSYITGSQHYKYARIRDGGWGQKGPIPPADLTFISRQKRKDRMNTKVSQSLNNS